MNKDTRSNLTEEQRRALVLSAEAVELEYAQRTTLYFKPEQQFNLLIPFVSCAMCSKAHHAPGTTKSIPWGTCSRHACQLYSSPCSGMLFVCALSRTYPALGTGVSSCVTVRVHPYRGATSASLQAPSTFTLSRRSRWTIEARHLGSPASLLVGSSMRWRL